jgi:nucleoside phosphorylase
MYSKRPVGKDDTNASGSSKKLKLDSKHVAWTVFQKNLRNEEYTVGWICAIPTEYVAAQVFLDATHGQPERVPHNDNNNYILGEIGEHNIVIAVLPKGVYGTTSATSVAKDMLRTFPNIKIGLMVGIGGGAPSPKHDIRLGDIVVSTPYNKEGGVLQYDVGKAIQKKQFKVTGHLNQPPTVLQTAVSGLEAHYELHGHQFQNTINNILENHPRLKKKYKRPDPNTDKLYLSRVLHPDDDDTNCIQVCSSDPSDLISQEPRLSDQNNPAVHYGIVASGNKLMKDALLRDKFARENDVLCFEMEAAGLMNHFPCLVIRGICDYSDSHKNKVWQGYAAMAASAYARDLLSSIPVNKIVAESRINDVLSSG